MELSQHDSLGLVAGVTLSLQLAIFWLKWRYGRDSRGALERKAEEL